MLKTHRCNEFGMEKEVYYGEMKLAYFECIMRGRYDYSSETIISYSYTYWRRSSIS